MRSLEAGARSIRDVNSFLIFPEGTRSRTDDLLPFKKGGFVMALKAGAPIVPVAIRGGREAHLRGSWMIQPVTVRITVGTPIETTGYGQGDRDDLIQKVRGAIVDLLRQDRAADAGAD
jgi:1-acyl-sn-glycerol-3-phosphate acyltransferase